MKKLWPFESGFSSMNFGLQPIWLVLNALSEGRRLEKERLHHQEMAVAQLTSIYFNSQKTKPPYTRASDFYCFPLEEQSSISPVICNTFLSLCRDESLPSWALRLAPVDELQKGASDGGSTSKPRLWMCRGIALICPVLEDEVLSVGLAIVDDDAPSGRVTVWDVDTGEAHVVWLPKVDDVFVLEGVWSWENPHS
ncbi:hypothetical protein JYQ62_22100 [Nostoc sp. UHCC 0702]|nr:hypothetical protein JYQ62_22100 [Nostoc sp. UHCC 0702]